jgi:hypothetical protein
MPKEEEPVIVQEPTNTGSQFDISYPTPLNLSLVLSSRVQTWGWEFSFLLIGLLSEYDGINRKKFFTN